MGVRYFALISGIVYLVVGFLGFVPNMLQEPPAGAPDLAIDRGYGYLMGLFPVNVLHNLVHILIGIWGLVAYRRFSPSRFFAKGLAIIYGIFTLMGLIPGLDTTFGLVPLFSHDIWLHALTALIAAYFGFRKAEDPADRTVVSASPGR